MIYIIGIGVQGKGSLTGRPLGIIEEAGLLVGGKRHLEEFNEVKAKKAAITGSLEGVVSAISGYKGRGKNDIVVLATGDPLLFGIAGLIVKKFGKSNVEIIPNVSTVQEAFARIKESSNGLKVLSAHGRGADLDALSAEIIKGNKFAVFTDPENTPSKMARKLLDAGAEGFRAYVCESLGTKDERVTEGTLAAISRRRSFAPLNILVLIREKAPAAPSAFKKTGIPDELFSHSAGMITKQELRVIALSKLALEADSIVWDIGSCSGSVAIEAARIASNGRVWAIEKDKDRVKDMEKNKESFNAENLVIMEGEAPGRLRGEKPELPAPDAVFIGGGGAGIKGILGYVSRRIKKGGRVVVNAVTIETAHTAFDFLKTKGWERELVLISMSKARSLGELNLLNANNPVFIITGVKPGGKNER